MKITLSAAMRARDVSRPRPEQLADAADWAESRAAANDEARTPHPPRGDTAPAAQDAQPRSRRRRRRTR